MDISNENARLSIITVNYNNKNGLQKTIDSVVSQTFREFEWIIIDGGSTDGSQELIGQYADKITYWISEPDKGIYNAMNKGIKIANGEYLLFLNSGDYFADKYVLCKVVPLLKSADFYVGDELHENRIWSSKISTSEDICKTLTLYSLPHQSTFISKKIFTLYGLYREDLMIVSDWWLCYKAIILNNASIAKIPLVISTFESAGISSSQEVNSKERFYCFSELPRLVSLFEFYCKNYEIVSALKGTSWFFQFFRIYFYIYRKWLKKMD